MSSSIEDKIAERVARWEKAGYGQLSISERCLDCNYGPTEPEWEPTLYMNYKTGFIFCPSCGARHLV